MKNSIYFLVNMVFLRNIIIEHDECSRIISKCNNHIKYLIGFVYYIGFPTLDIGILIAISDKSSFLIKLLFLFLVMEAGLIIFGLNLEAASLCKAAKSPYVKLNSIIVSNTMNLNTRIKIMSYIEKFSGPEISISCFDFFPINNFEFYLLVVNVVNTFILFLDVFGKEF